MKKQNPFLVTEAQNGWDGKGPLEIALSNNSQAESPTVRCPWPSLLLATLIYQENIPYYWICYVSSFL